MAAPTALSHEAAAARTRSASRSNHGSRMYCRNSRGAAEIRYVQAVTLLTVSMADCQKFPEDTNQIETLTIEQARAVAQYDHLLYLNGLITASDEAANAVRANPAIQLPEKFRRCPYAAATAAALSLVADAGEPRLAALATDAGSPSVSMLTRRCTIP